ncbi:MAG TPA: hypothetical protein VGY97_07750 [Solirubrobacteraceae bacterium]|nr:hypothetical protein [Solirubrobacteraceae bacterium]
MSAITRLERHDDLSSDATRAALERLGLPASLEIVTLDDRLTEAARREGFVVRGDA